MFQVPPVRGTLSTNPGAIEREPRGVTLLQFAIDRCRTPEDPRRETRKASICRGAEPGTSAALGDMEPVVWTVRALVYLWLVALVAATGTALSLAWRAWRLGFLSSDVGCAAPLARTRSTVAIMAQESPDRRRSKVIVFRPDLERRPKPATSARPVARIPAAASMRR